MRLGYDYMRKKLARLGGYSTHWDAADMSDLFYFYYVFIWSRRMTRLQRSRPSKQNGMNKNRYELFSQPVEMKIIVKWLRDLRMIGVLSFYVLPC